MCFGKLKNEGTIINEGILDQTVNAASIGDGYILTSTKPDMYRTYSNIYYKAELEYPGQIKVNVIRESRVVDYAK